MRSLVGRVSHEWQQRKAEAHTDTNVWSVWSVSARQATARRSVLCWAPQHSGTPGCTPSDMCQCEVMLMLVGVALLPPLRT